MRLVDICKMWKIKEQKLRNHRKTAERANVPQHIADLSDLMSIYVIHIDKHIVCTESTWQNKLSRRAASNRDVVASYTNKFIPRHHTKQRFISKIKAQEWQTENKTITEKETRK